MPGDRAAGGDELVGGSAEVADGEERGRGADRRSGWVKARIGTAARLTWSRTQKAQVPTPPVATQADSSPVSTTAQITGPNAARASSRSTFRPGRAGAAFGAAVAVTGGTAAAAGCWPPRTASWPTSRCRRTAG